MKSFSEFQARADAVASALGDGAAPRWLAGESLIDFRKRLAIRFQHLSPKWMHADLSSVKDDALLAVAEAGIYADAMTEAANPNITLPVDRLKEVATADATGRKITRFYGNPAFCWDVFKSPGRRIVGFGGR